jgi:hypothetical protein
MSGADEKTARFIRYDWFIKQNVIYDVISIFLAHIAAMYVEPFE